VCFEREGDKIWVKDRSSNSQSAIAKWRFPWTAREGYCRNRLGAPNWGVCNKDFDEGFEFYWWAANYNREDDSFNNWSFGTHTAS
jgi:hypothetical protein